MQTNVRLIDANAFIANLEKVEKEIRKGELPKRYLAGLLSCIAYAKSAPTVDISELQEKAKTLDDINRKIRQLGNKGL